MEMVRSGLNWKSCLAYLDDVVILGLDEQELIDRMDEVISRLKEVGLKLKPKKYKFFTKEINYLGYVISASGRAVSSEKISAVSEWLVPERVTDVRSFLNTARYYRRCVKDFATFAALLQSDRPWKEIPMGCRLSTELSIN